MSNTIRNYEEPLDDSIEADIEAECQFDPVRALQNLMPRGIRKAQVTLFLDDDILAHFKQLAEQAPATSVQSQINQALRAVLQQHQNQMTEQSATKWLNSPLFIKLLDERIHAVVTDRSIAA